MIKISQIIDAAAAMAAAEGVTVYKTACPKDFARPSLYIVATKENITFGIGRVMNVVTTLTATSYVQLDENGDASGEDLTAAAQRVTGAFAKAGGINVGDYFLQISRIKSNTEKDSVKTIIKLSYSDIPEIEEPDYDTAGEASIGVGIKEGR